MGLGQRFGHGDSGRRNGRRPADPDGRWLRRQVRGWRPDRNPLRRGTDRAETFLIAGLIAATAAGAPFAAQAASRAASAAGLRAQQQQQADRYRADTVLTEPAGTVVAGYSVTTTVPAAASWTSASGEHRSGEVLAPTGSARGTHVSIWTDASGGLASPPLTAAQIADQGDAAMIGALAGVVVVFLTGAGTVHHVLYRRRMSAWEADWLATEPTWHHQQSW